MPWMPSAVLYRRHQIGHFLLAKALQGQNLVGGKVIDVGHVPEKAQLDEKLCLADAEPFDVHGSPAGKVLH
jgi:hypothetical protein